MTFTKAPFDIPYRLETLEDITTAIRTNFLNLGARYHSMYALARRTGALRPPPALTAARRHVRWEFHRVDETVLRELDLEYVEVANLDLVEGFERIESQLPGVARLAACGELLEAVATFPAPVREACRIRGDGTASADLLGMLDSIEAIRELLASEILACVRTGRPRRIGMADLKELLVACALFRPENDDVRLAIRRARPNDAALYQNALAELLFRRLPRYLDVLTRIEPNRVRRKFFSRVAKMDLTPNQKTNLFGCFEPNLKRRDLPRTLDQIETIAENLPLSTAARRRLGDYLGSLRREIRTIHELYGSWFLPTDLRRMRRLYRPRGLMEPKIVDWGRIVRTVTRVATLDFYPTRDWMDLCKARASSDCSGSRLGERHLLAGEFFNIRIFSEGGWIGNIYMLDYTRETGCLLVDRIQIPRKIPAEFIRFFHDLGGLFGELFADVPYEEIVMPLRISNHGAVQGAFNGYKDGLPARTIRFPGGQRSSFESVRQRKPYRVLRRRSEPALPADEPARRPRSAALEPGEAAPPVRPTDRGCGGASRRAPDRGTGIRTPSAVPAPPGRSPAAARRPSRRTRAGQGTRASAGASAARGSGRASS